MDREAFERDGGLHAGRRLDDDALDAFRTLAEGRIAATDADQRAADAHQRICFAEVGDVWAYRTPILHASDPSSGERRRRVLQVDYADFELPGGLRWSGIE